MAFLALLAFWMRRKCQSCHRGVRDTALKNKKKVIFFQNVIFAIFAYNKQDPCSGSDSSGERRMLVVSKIENTSLNANLLAPCLHEFLIRYILGN